MKIKKKLFIYIIFFASSISFSQQAQEKKDSAVQTSKSISEAGKNGASAAKPQVGNLKTPQVISQVETQQVSTTTTPITTNGKKPTIPVVLPSNTPETTTQISTVKTEVTQTSKPDVVTQVQKETTVTDVKSTVIAPTGKETPVAKPLATPTVSKLPETATIAAPSVGVSQPQPLTPTLDVSKALPVQPTELKEIGPAPTTAAPTVSKSQEPASEISKSRRVVSQPRTSTTALDVGKAPAIKATRPSRAPIVTEPAPAEIPQGVPTEQLQVKEEEPKAEEVKPAEPIAEKSPEKKAAPKTETLEKTLKIEPEKFIDKDFIRPDFSMADRPISKAERKIVKREIYEPDKPDIETAPESFDALIVTEKKSPLAGKDVFLGQKLEPWVGMDPKQKVEIHFENEEIKDFLKFLERNLNVTFILDDYIQPSRAEGLQPIGGTKVTFKSNTPLTLKETWDLGITFLEMAGFAIVPTTLSRTYHVTKSKPTANKDPLPTFIGTDSDLIVDNDSKIRYVYFAENTELDTLLKIIEPLKSNSAGDLIKFPELRAIMITDKASNIKSLVKMLEEIDQGGIPEALSIIHLKHADAKRVQDLWTALVGEEKPTFPFGRPRKTPTVHYFTKETRVIGDSITNSLIVLGKRENIKKLEEFIFRYIDKKSDLPYSPLHIYQLRYIDSDSISQIINDTIGQFNAAQTARVEAAKYGGVRDGNKFFAPWVRLTSEPSGNRVVINADYEDYLFIRDILDKLDVEQPQVALRVLILDVDITDLTQFGTQLRNKKDCCDGSGGTDSILGRNINFQYAGLNGFITREAATPLGTGGPPFVNGVNRLLGNLINLAGIPAGGGPLFTTGTTLVSLGRDIFGFWGLLRILQSITRVSVVSNPFLVTTHKYKAEISVGETRRVVSANVVGQTTQQAFSDLEANLQVIITPQISYDDVVTLNIYIDVSQFITRTDFPVVLRKQISTEAIAANKEVIALGGLIRDNIVEIETKVPILGDIPLLGWLFKNKSKTVQRMSLLILIAPEIIRPHEPEVAREFTYAQITDAKENLYRMDRPYERRDPIHRWLFFDHKEKEIHSIDKFVSRQSRYVSASQRQRIGPLLALDEEKIKEKSKENKNLLELVKDNGNKQEIKV